MAQGAETGFVDWPERAGRGVPSCLFTGAATTVDVIAARLISAIAAGLPDMLFHVAGEVCGGIGRVPSNVRLHARPAPELLARSTLGLSPVPELVTTDERVVSYSRAGLPVIASPASSRGFASGLVDCWLVVSPEPCALRDAIVESVEWDWSAAVATARRLVA
jgi:hypothetical protein